jgi:hypothetical protein
MDVAAAFPFAISNQMHRYFLINIFDRKSSTKSAGVCVLPNEAGK